MKKILAAVLATVMVFALAAGTVVSAVASVAVESLDNVYVNGEMMFNGGADAWFAANEIKGKIQTLGVRGWIIMGASQVPSSFGYKIDNGDPVKCDDSVVYDEAIVTATGAANIRRDVISADVTKVGLGEHTFTIAAWNDADEVAYGKSFTFTQELAPDEEPGALPPANKGFALDAFQYWQGGALGATPAVFTHGDVQGFHIAGWTGYNYEVLAIGYRINGVETFVDGAINYNPEQPVKDAGGEYAVRFSMDGSFESLLLGANDFDIIVKVNDPTETVVDLFSNIPCQVIPTADEAIWFYDPAAKYNNNDPYNVGYWIGPDAGVVNGNISIAFTAPDSFDGVFGFKYSGTGAQVNVILRDEAGNDLDEVKEIFAGDGYAATYFSRKYPAGKYTLDYVFNDDMGGYFVLGSGTPTENAATMTGIHNVSFADAAPAIALIKAEMTEEEKLAFESDLTLLYDVAPATVNNAIQMRGFTASPDGKYVYGGFLQGGRYVVRFDAENGFAQAGSYKPAYTTDNELYCKGLAVDDRGYLYVGVTHSGNPDIGIAVVNENMEQIGLYTEDLGSANTGINGVAVRKLGAKYLLYVVTAYDVDGIRCYDVTDPENIVPNKYFGVVGAMDYSILDADKDPSYVAVDANGFVYLTYLKSASGYSKGSHVSKLSADGKKVLATAEIKQAYGICEFGDYVFVATYDKTASCVHVLKKSDLSEVTVLTYAEQGSTNFSDIAFGGGTLFVGDQGNDATIGGRFLKADLELNAEEEVTETKASGVQFASLYYDDTAVFEKSAYKKVGDPANRDKIDYINGKVSTITFNGRAKFSLPITGYGYVIDDGEVVPGDFDVDVTATNNGAYGYAVVVPVDGLAEGEHTITVVGIDYNGEPVTLIKTDSGIDYPVALTFTVRDPFTFDDSEFVPVVTDTFDGSIGDNWKTQGGPSVTDDGHMTLNYPNTSNWTTSGYAAYLKNVDYTRPYVIEFKAMFGVYGLYSGVGLRGADYTDENNNAAYANFNNGSRWGQGVESANGLAIDINVPFYPQGFGLSFEDGTTGGDQPYAIIQYPAGFDVSAEHTYKLVDTGDVIAMFVDGEWWFKVELSELADGKYTHAVVYDYNYTVQFDGAISLNETGYFGFYQRASGVAVDEVTFKSAPVKCTGNAALDNFRYDSTDLGEGSLYKWINNEANREALNFTEGEVSSVYFRGWAQLDRPVAGFGYVIDDGEVVTDASFVEDRAAELAQATFDNAQGYAVTVPVADLAVGDHTIKIVALDADNNAVDVFKTKDGVDYPIAITFTVAEAAVVSPAELINANFDIFELGNKVLTLQGWAGANFPANNLGYKVDGGEVVLDGIEFAAIHPAEADAIHTLAGPDAFRFKTAGSGITLDLEPGEHTITIVVRVNDGTQNYIVEMGSKTFTVNAEPDPAALGLYSFNTVWIDGEQVCDVGDATTMYLNANPIVDAQTIGLRGWAQIKNTTREAYGYRIDDGEPVFDASYTQDRTDLGGVGTQDVANGFCINPIDVSEVAPGSHTITVMMKGADGNYVDVVTVPFTVTLPPALVSYSLDYYALYSRGADCAALSEFDIGMYDGGRVRGWAGFNYPIARIGYRLNGVDVFPDGVAITEGDDAVKAAGGEYAVRYDMICSYADMVVGENELLLIAELDDGNNTVLPFFGPYVFTGLEPGSIAAPNTTFFSATHPSAVSGWWTGPAVSPTLVNGKLDFTFDTPWSFNGICFMMYANNATVEINLYNELGILLETKTEVYAADGVPSVYFDNAYGPGVYTLEFKFIEGNYFVFAAGTPSNIPVDVQYTNYITNADTLQAPVMFLWGANDPNTPEPNCLNAAFDDLHYDDTVLCSQKAYLWAADPANRAALDFDKLSVDSIYLRGWAQLDKPILTFGYRIDGGTPVVNDAFIEDRAAELESQSVPGGQGFAVTVPVDKLAYGEHTIEIIAVDEDGMYVPVVKVKEGVTYNVGVTFTINRPTDHESVLTNKNFDNYYVNGVDLGQLGTGRVDTAYIEAYDQVYALNAYTPFTNTPNTAGIGGWVGFDGEYVESFGYSIDDGPSITDPSFIIDRNAELANAGFPYGQGYRMVFDYSDLTPGEHTVRFFATAVDGQEHDFYSYTFEVAEVGTWLFDPAQGANIGTGIGWWTGKNVNENYADGDVSIEFTTPDAFDGVYTIYWADFMPGAIMDVNLYDENEELLETVPFAFANNGALTLKFSQTYAPGTYTLQYIFSEPRGHFVLGAGAHNDIETAVYGACNNSGDDTYAPAIALLAAEYTEPVAAACQNAAWDDLKYDDEVLCSAKAYKWVVDNAAALNYEEGTVSGIYFRGWAQLNTAITGFGYIVDGGDVVTDPRFIDDRSAELATAFPGGQGFAFTVPVDGLAAGEHTIKVVAIAEDGSVVELFKTKDGVDYPIALTFTITEAAGSGDDTGDQPGDDTGDQPGDDTGDQPGDDTGDQPGDDTGDQPGDDTGDQPGDDTGDQPGDEPKVGDINEDDEVNNKDVVLLFRYVSGGGAYDEKYDINGDGEVNNKDVVVLFRQVSAALNN